MPNYSLVANTVFKNRSFDDMLKPLAMYTQEYNSLENAANELESKASIWEGMADEERDPIAYAQYKRYADDLKQQALSLASQGLTPETRRSILNLKKRYSSEIAPIEQAYTNRKLQADEQRKALLQNPTLLLSRRADATSLDKYLQNPELGYDSYSGALLTSQVGTAASALAKELRDYGNGKKLDAYTKTWLQQHGYTADEVMRAINNPDDPKSSKVLNSLVNNVMADSGIANWADRGTLNQAYEYAKQGLWQAVGQTTVTPYEDYGARLAAQIAAQKKASEDVPTPRGTNFEVRNVSTQKERDELMKQKDVWNNKYKQYFYRDKDGEWHINAKGLRKLHEEFEYSKYSKINNGVIPYPAGAPIVGGGGNYVPFIGENDLKGSPFTKFVEKIGLVTKVGTSDKNKNRIAVHYDSNKNTIMDDFIGRIKGVTDMKKAVEYYTKVDPADYDNVVSALNRLVDNEEIPTYDMVNEKGNYSLSAGKSKISDLGVDKQFTASDIGSASVVFGKHGNYLEAVVQGNKVKIPYNLVSSSRDALMTGSINDVLRANAYNNRLSQVPSGTAYKDKETGAIFTTDGSGNVIVQNGQTGEIMYYDDYVNFLLNNGSANGISGLGTSKPKTVEVPQGNYNSVFGWYGK